MYLDNNLLLAGSVSAAGAWTPQTATGTNTSVLSTNAIDLSVARDMGEGQDLFARAECTTAASGGTTVEFQVIASDAANGTGNVQVVGTTGPIPVASVTLGSRFALGINPRLALKGQRYLTGNFVFVGAVAAGAYIMDIGLDVQDGQKLYPNGFAVL